MPGHRPDPDVPRYPRFSGCLLSAAMLFCVFLFAKAVPAQAQSVDDPCPALEDILSGKTPDDLSLVQADIDRYTLCAKRAELLKKLNELTVENEKAVGGGAGVQNPGMTLGKGTPKAVFPPIVPVVNIPPVAPVAPVDGEDVPAEDDGSWKIVEIFGVSGKLQAKLTKSDGSVARVKAGTALSDGGSVVAITPVHVTIRNADGETELSWKE